MNSIKIIHTPSQQQLDEIGVADWPVWECEVSTFPWRYEQSETCYILAGEVTVTPDQGEPVTIGSGDLVTFPSGMACTWQVTAPIRKHYSFH